MKLQNVNKRSGSLSVTLPKALVTAYGWQAGDQLGFRVEKPGQITLFKK